MTEILNTRGISQPISAPITMPEKPRETSPIRPPMKIRGFIRRFYVSAPTPASAFIADAVNERLDTSGSRNRVDMADPDISGHARAALIVVIAWVYLLCEDLSSGCAILRKIGGASRRESVCQYV